MQIKLPDVTLVIVADDAVRDITQWVLDRTLAMLSPAAVEWHDEFDDAQQKLWNACASVSTSHALVVQYDGFPLDPWMWKEEFLKYDYIGAPWPHVQYKVGNGGFSLRSRKLSQKLLDLPLGYPEDTTIRNYYDDGKLGDCVFAPTHIGHQFSFERCPKRRSFGTHGIFNMPKVLTKDELEHWMNLAEENIRAKVEWPELEAQLQ